MGNAQAKRSGEWAVVNGEWAIPQVEWSLAKSKWKGASIHDRGTNSPNHRLPFAIRLFLVVGILLLPTLLRAQEIIITLNITPPYSAYVYNYADLTNQAIITLANTTQELKQVRLEGSMTNATAGLFVRTEPGHRGPQPITVPPGGSVVLSSQPGLMDFLDPQYVTTNADDAVQQAIVQSGQLPEGVYRLCVEAYDYNGPQLLSQPGGGCFSFALYYANPPIITQPVNGTEVSAYQTNPVFTWTPPLGNLAGALIAYDLLVTPVFPGQNPNDAIIAARTYQRAQPVLLKEGLLTNVYVRQVFDLPFEQGKQYAMQVTARDRNSIVGISNLGRSEISVFTVGTVETPVIPYSGTAPGGNAPIIDPGISPAFTESTLRGKLHYFWHNPSNHGATAATGGGSVNSGALGSLGAVGSGAVQPGADATGNRAGFSGFTQAPLAGVTVQLVQAIQFQNAPTTTPLAGPLLPGNILVTHTGQFHIQGQPTMSAPTLATATTDAQGNFIFNVPHVQQLDFGWKQGTVTLSGDFTGNLEGSYTGTFRRVLMVRVGNPARTYYAQPVQFNSSLPANRDLGLFYAQVKSMDVKVRVAERNDLNVTKAGVEVLLLRKVGSRPTLAPADEASRGNLSADPTIVAEGQEYVILARDTADSQGMAEFRDLVRFDCAPTGSNLYYTWVRYVDDFTTQYSFESHPKPIHYAYQSDWTNACFVPTADLFKESCMRCELAGRDGYSTPARNHPRAYKGQDEWLFHVQRVVNRPPAVTATVRNSAAGTQAAFALAEPNANWKLWRINKEGMEFLRNSNPSWGAMLESNQPDAFQMMANVMVPNGRMVLHTSGITGSDGRIHRKGLAVQKEGAVPVGFYYVLDVEKPGFNRVIKVVNRIVLNGTGAISTGSIVQTSPNLLNALGGGGSSGGSSSSSSSSNAAPNSGDVSMLREGFQYNAGEIFIAPKGKVKVVLVNEAGQTLLASAHYRDPATGQEGVIVGSTFNSATNRREVLLDVPTGNGLQVVIIPNDLEQYDRDTITVNVPATGTLTTTATVPYKLHRIHFIVREEPATAQALLPGQDPESVGMPLANARVVLINASPVMHPAIKHPSTNPGGTAASVPGQPYERTTDSQGRVDFAFRASGQAFTFRVYAPQGGNQVTREITVGSTAGKHWQVKHVQLKPGRTVRGTVTIDSAAVANARVRYVHGNLIAEVMTNAQGRYTLTNVPLDPLEFTASKPGYLGMEYDEATGNANALGTIATNTLTNYSGQVVETVIDFQLRVYGGMDFSTILGFPLEVTAFSEEPAGRARINGWVTVPDSANSVFRMTQASASGNDLRSVRFLNTVVEPDPMIVQQIGGNLISPAKPVSLPMPLAVNEVAVGLYPQAGNEPFAYHATLRDQQQGIALDRPAGSDARGAVHGGVLVSLASFQVSSFSMPAGQGLALNAPGGGLRIPVFASNAQSWFPATQAWNVSAADGQPLGYTLFGFQAGSITSGSLLSRDSLVLDTRIHTALEHIPAPDNDLNLAVGGIVFRDRQLQPFDRVKSFTIPLGQFSLQGTELSLGNGGFRFKGTLLASGMELAVTDGTLEPTRFLLGEMNAGNMRLIGAIPVNATRPAEFGYDAVRPQPAWYVVVTSRDHNVAGATISGQHLDGIPDDRDIPITSIWLYSNGAQEVSLRSGIPEFPLYGGIAGFNLQSMAIQSNLVRLSGELNLGIPGLPTFTTAMLYDKLPNGLSAYRLQDFNMPPVNVNGVQIAFNKGAQRGSFGVPGNQHCLTFTQGQLIIKGVISDQDPEVFKNLAYTLTKTPQLTRLVVDRDPQQSVRLGGDNPGSRILMTDVEGEMTVLNGPDGPAWNTFYIKGNMPEEMGFEPQNGQPQRMRFEVRGDLAVEGQQIKLKDIETPFGNINMVYDMQYHRLTGSLNIAHNVEGGPSMSGAATICIDRDGFYFMAGLNVLLSDPQINGYAFVLLGDYRTRTPEMDALLMQYSLHVQKKIERQLPAFMQTVIAQLAAQYPQQAVQMATSQIPNLFPPTYNGLFGSGRFNGFYFEAGAQIPLPIIPSFEISLDPIMSVELGLDGGIDVRFGANFGSGTFGVGFDTFVDLYLGGGTNGGYYCFAGRIGAYVTVGLDGVFNTNGQYNITGSGGVELTGSITVAGGACTSITCDDGLCLHVKLSGSLSMGMQATFNNSGSDFRFTMSANNTTQVRNDPPPQEN